jgi:hypothetical protein
MDCKEKGNKISFNYYSCGRCGVDCCEDNDIIDNNCAVPTGGLNESSLILRPDLWTVGVEHDLGAGLYGHRFKGEITQSAAVEKSMMLINLGVTAQLWDCGGSWHHGSSYIMLGEANGSALTSRLVLIDVFAGSAKGDLYFNSLTAQPRTNAPYDIWVKYTK